MIKTRDFRSGTVSLKSEQKSGKSRKKSEQKEAEISVLSGVECLNYFCVRYFFIVFFQGPGCPRPNISSILETPHFLTKISSLFLMKVAPEGSGVPGPTGRLQAAQRFLIVLFEREAPRATFVMVSEQRFFDGFDPSRVTNNGPNNINNNNNNNLVLVRTVHLRQWV